MAETTMKLNGRILEAVTVDFWGTIAFDSTLQKRRERRAEYMLEWVKDQGMEISREKLVETLYKYHDLWHEDWQRRRITHDAEHMVRFLVDQFKLETSEEAIASLADKLDMTLMEIQPELMDGARDVLQRFHRLGIPLAIISDTAMSGPKSLDTLLEQWGLLDVFPVRIYSEQTGVAKPHPKAYLAASEALGVPQHRLVHVGDLEATDIIGAKSIGIAAIRFDGKKEKSECKTCSMADKVVANWAEIRDLLLDGVAGNEDPFLKVSAS